ncbi:MAG: PAS domain-containing protein [Epsilonproteobacteria bacterium]|nr:PAS domain-containing protein [Campylobacterota bacterium]
MKKPHIKPTDKETVLKDGEFIVSKTDLKSRITYGNAYFISISGYSEEELLGAPHNILRHPDVPRCAFKMLYTLLEAGEEFFGFVKNLKKDGGYYWVFANITPSFDESGKVVGYYSVRRKPREGFKKVIEPLYQKLKEIEDKEGMEASVKAVQDLLAQKNVSFNEFMLGIQKGVINEL